MVLHRRTTAAFVVATLLAVGAAGAGCGSDSPADGERLTKVRYGLPTTTYSVTTVGVQFAIARGYFRDVGLDVEVRPLNGSTAPIRAVLSGDIDIAQTGPDTAVLAVQAGSPLRAIGSPLTKDTGVVFSDSDIKSLADLRGKTYAISAPGSSSATQIQTILRNHNLDPGAVNYVAVGAPDARVRALLGDRVDATSATILVLQPILEAIAKGEVNILARSSEEFPDLPLSYDVVTENMIKEKRDVLVRFLTAQLRGFRWALANPAEAAKIAVEFVKDTSVELMTSALQQLADIKAFGVDGITMDGIGRTVDSMVALKVLAKKTEPAEFADASLVEEAIRRLSASPGS